MGSPIKGSGVESGFDLCITEYSFSSHLVYHEQVLCSFQGALEFCPSTSSGHQISQQANTTPLRSTNYAGHASPLINKVSFFNAVPIFIGLPCVARRAKHGGGGGSRTLGGSHNHTGLHQPTECLPNDRHFNIRCSQLFEIS